MSEKTDRIIMETEWVYTAKDKRSSPSRFSIS
jgi:hypothetical protein